MKALILDNKVVDVSENEFEVHESMFWVDCPNDCQLYWTYEDATFRAPAKPPEPSYAALREQQYPTLQEQLDMQYWDSINGTTVWADTIAAIKAEFPKPE